MDNGAINDFIIQNLLLNIQVHLCCETQRAHWSHPSLCRFYVCFFNYSFLGKNSSQFGVVYIQNVDYLAFWGRSRVLSLEFMGGNPSACQKILSLPHQVWKSEKIVSHVNAYVDKYVWGYLIKTYLDIWLSSSFS